MRFAGRSGRTHVYLLVGFLALLPWGGAAAQSTDARRAQATRAELEASLTEIEQVLGSPGYSGRVKAAKRLEADLIRRRLTEGDFTPGDQITLSVVGEQALSATFTVRPGHLLVLPDLAEVSLRGVLRSELREHLVAELSRYIRNPQVDITGAGVRVAILGAVGQPGYYTVPVEQGASEAIMQAGGPAGNAALTKAVIRRNGREIVGADELRAAILAGMSLDQLNIHGGDEIYVPTQRAGGIQPILTVAQVITGLGFAVFSLSRIF